MGGGREHHGRHDDHSGRGRLLADDLDELPDDGNRYELVDGLLLVSPPSLTVLELHGGAYVEVARVEGEQAWTATQPFPVTVVPAELLR